jgi:hypothetical protein
MKEEVMPNRFSTEICFNYQETVDVSVSTEIERG